MIIEKEFKEKPETVFADLMSNNKSEKSANQLKNSPSNSLLQLTPVASSIQHKLVVEDDLRNLYFGDFMRDKDEASGARSYKEITNVEKLKNVI